MAKPIIKESTPKQPVQDKPKPANQSIKDNNLNIRYDNYGRQVKE